MASAGLIGLSMLIQLITTEKIVMVVLLIFFSLTGLSHAIKTNNELRRLRVLCWSCYGELVSHSLLHKERDAEEGRALAYQQ
jgi:hypothetical protein